jgi:hypothetical protein
MLFSPAEVISPLGLLENSYISKNFPKNAFHFHDQSATLQNPAYIVFRQSPFRRFASITVNDRNQLNEAVAGN